MVGALHRPQYGLPQPKPVRTLENLGKALGYGLLLKREKMFAHAGSAAGARAWARGETALVHEGLAELP